MPIHRLTKLAVDNLEQQLSYAEKKKLSVFDDVNKYIYALLCEYRNILDGDKFIGNQKFKDPRPFNLPGVLISTNCAEAALLDTEKPENDDKFFSFENSWLPLASTHSPTCYT